MSPMVKLAVSRRVGAYAGVVLVTVVSFLLTGAIWGALRPGYQATVVEGNRVELGTETNVEFTAFFWFVVITAVLGGVIAMVTFIKSAPTRGVMMLLWIVAWVLLATQGFVFVGEWVTNLLHGVGNPDALSVGDTVTYVPYFSAGVAGNLIGGFWAALLYWCCLVSAPAEQHEAATQDGNPDEADPADVSPALESQAAGEK